MPFPISLIFGVPNLYDNQPIDLTLYSGLTVLVGPNASGKTQVLRALKTQLIQHAANRKIRYISAGRLASLEDFRSNQYGNNHNLHPENATFGHSHNRASRHLSETISGDFLTLAARPDIQIKIKERLSKLFEREIFIEWQQGNLKAEFKTKNGNKYPGGIEASGLLNLISLLIAIYDDEVGVLLIDEPEISLHPQLQTFLYQEIAKIAGDPNSRRNKIVILSTHSTEFITIRKASDISHIAFFHTAQKKPVQVSPTTPELQNRRLQSLLTRLGLNQKLAFFSNRPLLVEGPTDQTICSALENKLSIYLGAAGSQIVAVSGKGQLPIVNKLFKLIGKTPVILTDIDSIADNSDLINSIQFDTPTEQTANEMGAASVHALAASVYNSFCQMLQAHWQDISAQVERTSIWLNRDQSNPNNEIIYKRRSGMVTLLNAPDNYFQNIQNGENWLAIKTRLKSVFELIARGGCFVLSKGYIEDYYIFAQMQPPREKTEIAVDEMIGIEDSHDLDLIELQYADIIRALKFAAKVSEIDEAGEMAKLLLSVATPVIYKLGPALTAGEANTIASQIVGEKADLFIFNIVTTDTGTTMTIDNKSLILDVTGFPISFSQNSNPVDVVRHQIVRANH